MDWRSLHRPNWRKLLPTANCEAPLYDVSNNTTVLSVVEVWKFFEICRGYLIERIFLGYNVLRFSRNSMTRTVNLKNLRTFLPIKFKEKLSNVD